MPRFVPTPAGAHRPHSLAFDRPAAQLLQGARVLNVGRHPRWDLRAILREAVSSRTKATSKATCVGSRRTVS